MHRSAGDRQTLGHLFGVHGKAPWLVLIINLLSPLPLYLRERRYSAPPLLCTPGEGRNRPPLPVLRERGEIAPSPGVPGEGRSQFKITNGDTVEAASCSVMGLSSQGWPSTRSP